MDNKKSDKPSVYERGVKDVLFDIAIVINAIIGGLVIAAVAYLLFVIVIIGRTFGVPFSGIALVSSWLIVIAPGFVFSLIVGRACIKTCMNWFKGKSIRNANGWIGAVGMLLMTFGSTLSSIIYLGRGIFNVRLMIGEILELIPFLCAIVIIFCVITNPARISGKAEAHSSAANDEIAADVATHALGHGAPTDSTVTTEKEKKELPPMLNADPEASSTSAPSEDNSAGSPTIIPDHSVTAAEAEVATTDAPVIQQQPVQPIEQPKQQESSAPVDPTADFGKL